MSASLVGSEMCIRDRRSPTREARLALLEALLVGNDAARHCAASAPSPPCLLYTSDAADDM
eukprot:12046092-Alexandrium_andersonii.AAC.1